MGFLAALEKCLKSISAAVFIYTHARVAHVIKHIKCSFKGAIRFLSLFFGLNFNLTFYVCMCKMCLWPPPITLQVAEGTINEAGSELSPSDEEGVNSHQLTPEVGWRSLSDVHGYCHRGYTCTAGGEGEAVVSTVNKGYCCTFLMCWIYWWLISCSLYSGCCRKAYSQRKYRVTWKEFALFYYFELLVFYMTCMWCTTYELIKEYL